MAKYRAWVSTAAKQKLVEQEIDPGPLGPDEVEIAVEYCGLCHSDKSVIEDEWAVTKFPFVPGHEAVGRIVALGERAKGRKIGQAVGIGWTAESCMHCRQCMGGDHHLCGSAVPTIVGHNGGFAERMRAHWAWTIPLPEGIDMTSTGPLLCGGVTVFTPIAGYGIQPSDHVGVIGIGGLGHMGVKFAHAWGCEVTAFTSSESKFDEAKSFGADHVLSTRDPKAIAAAASRFDLLISTVNVPLDWPALLNTLKPRGRLHIVGAVLEPVGIPAFALIMGQKNVSGSPTGSPNRLATMLEFAARKKVAPQVEHFPLSKVNDAIAHLSAGKARYRIVLDVNK
ncbi:NAD(P)-dependent alcohol dehydrogenase [Planctomyces sp. SH-PL14]|uniref:NADPH-dependent aldehyde reductase Ahr n=1 Tax=Planctomyces sp. SH-PL14 TaxID=1632864 RepID=UPI00078DCE3F|nr:NAD(P)-dependent alcohol dehydrogenase [Planctomyces sp. SH-PL14]AMV19329.1 Aldehyde reductase Ahr [Planctomyces sp. SH-PL14]